MQEVKGYEVKVGNIIEFNRWIDGEMVPTCLIIERIVKHEANGLDIASIDLVGSDYTHNVALDEDVLVV